MAPTEVFAGTHGENAKKPTAWWVFLYVIEKGSGVVPISWTPKSEDNPRTEVFDGKAAKV